MYSKNYKRGKRYRVYNTSEKLCGIMLPSFTVVDTHTVYGDNSRPIALTTHHRHVADICEAALNMIEKIRKIPFTIPQATERRESEILK